MWERSLASTVRDSGEHPFVYSQTFERWEEGWRIVSWLLVTVLLLLTPVVLGACRRHQAGAVISADRWAIYVARLRAAAAMALLALFLIAAPVPAMLHGLAAVSPVVTTFGIVDPAHETPDCVGVTISAPGYPTQPFCLGATARDLGRSRSGFRLELTGEQSIFGLAVTSYEFVPSVDIPAAAP